jgi:anti-sigma B factor antagonist
MRRELETEQVHPNAFVVSFAGELDLYSAPELKEELRRLVDGGARNLVVDLTATTFVDSTALGVLLRGAQRLRAVDRGRLAVVVSDENVRRIFTMTGLERVFPLYGTRDEALAEAG